MKKSEGSQAGTSWEEAVCSAIVKEYRIWSLEVKPLLLNQTSFTV